MRPARALVAATAAVTLSTSLACGPLFCVDTDQCWGEPPVFDTFTRRDTGFDQPDPSGPGIQSAHSECTEGGLHIESTFDGETTGARLFMGQLADDPGWGEEHPMPIDLLAPPRFFAADLDLVTVTSTEEVVPGVSTAFGCDDPEELATVTFVVFGEGAYSGPSCGVWGANPDIGDSLGCVRF